MRGQGRARRAPAFGAVALGVFCVQLDAFALNLALPDLAGDLGADTESIGWAVGVYLLAAGTLMIPAGRLGDRLGHHRVLTAGLALFGAASAACALAPDLPALLAARAAQGAGAAAIMPAGLALLTTAFPPGARSRATGWALGIGGAATAAGPFIGGAVTEGFGWPGVFWLNVPLTALAVLTAARSRPGAAAAAVDPSAGSGVGGRRRIGLLGLLAGTGALGWVAAYAEGAPAWGRLSGAAVAVPAAAAVLLLVFGAARRAASGPPDLALLREGPFAALTAAGSVANAAAVVFLFAVPLALQEDWDLGPGQAGLAFLAPAAAMALAGPVAGRVPPAWAPGVLAGCLCGGSAALWAVPAAGSPGALLPAAVCCGGLLGAANALTLTATQAVVRPERAGAASGLTKTAVTVTGGLGLGLTGAADTPAALAAVAAACLAAGLALALWAHRRHGRA
ncbi:MFS transporter [Allonocardiopsis opalescens]|nr:MFS transporter [Allonocardiopsis opalescens]